MTTPTSGDGEAPDGSGRDRRVDVPDGRVAVRVRGEGPPLLCLHGVSAHGGVWRRVADRLDDAFTLHVPDLLGRGASRAHGDASFRLEREAARAAALAAGLPDRGYLAAGHSQGAAVAVALAARAERQRAGGRRGRSTAAPGAGERGAAPGPGGGDRPGPTPRPAGLVLLAPVTPWTRRPLLLGALRARPVRHAVARALRPARRPLTRWVLEHRAFGDPAMVDAEAVRRWAAPWSDVPSGRTLLRVLADWRPAELSAHLPGVPPPSWVVAGALDRRIRPLDARRWAGRLGAGFSVARDAGHMLPVERPDLAAGAVRRVAERAGPQG